MTETVRVTAEKIRRLEVQGARNVAIAAIKALQTLAEQTKAKNKTAFLNELKEAQAVFFASRETEPLIRNAIRWVITQTEDSSTEKVDALSEMVFSNASLNSCKILRLQEKCRGNRRQTNPRWHVSFYALPLLNSNPL